MSLRSSARHLPWADKSRRSQCHLTGDPARDPAEKDHQQMPHCRRTTLSLALVLDDHHRADRAVPSKSFPETAPYRRFQCMKRWWCPDPALSGIGRKSRMDQIHLLMLQTLQDPRTSSPFVPLPLIEGSQKVRCRHAVRPS